MRDLKICAVALVFLSFVSEPANAQGTFSGAMAGRMGTGTSGPDSAAEITKAIKWAAAGRIDPKAKEPAAIDARGKYVFRTRADKQAKIEVLQWMLVIRIVPPILISDPKENQVGPLDVPWTDYYVAHVGSDSITVLAQTQPPESVVRKGLSKPGQCGFVLKGPIPGYSTAKLREGQKIHVISGVWRVGPKRNYEGPGEKERAIYDLTPVPIEQVLNPIVVPKKLSPPKAGPQPYSGGDADGRARKAR